MKRSGNGGSITIDGIEVAHVISWAYRESAPRMVGCESFITGSFDVIFDPSANHTLGLNETVNLVIKPSIDANLISILSAVITERSVNSSVDRLLNASFSFQCDGEVVYS